jgi:surface antigen
VSTLKQSRSWLVRLRALLLIPILIIGVLVGTASPASADTTLCTGNSYTSCINAGYTAHGYNASGNTSYWTMYAGHNCTNYAAYMASQNGAATPNYNLGSALTWASQAAAHGVPVDNIPAVGAIAQWNANAGYAGSSGHVAYVEAVTSNSITISEDNYNVGPFSWKVITSGSANWPSNFIHFADVASGSPSGLRAPSAITDPSTGRNIFYVGADNKIWQWSIQNGTWANIQLTGTGSTTSVASNTSPSAVVDSSGRNIFYVGSDNAIWQWSVQNGQWHNVRLGGSVAPGTSPSAVVDSATGRNVFYVGSDNAIWQFSIQNSNWSNFKLSGTGGAQAVAVDTSPAAIVDSITGRNVFYVGSDNQIWQWSVQAGQWHNSKLTGTGGAVAAATGGSPSVVIDSASGRNVFYAGTDNQIYQWSVQNGAWHNFKLTGTGGNTAALAGTSPSAIVDTSTGRNIFYVGSDGAIWQWSVQGGQWHNFKISGTGGNTAALTGTSPSAVFDSSTGRNVFYFDGNLRIWQWSVQNSAWHNFQMQ